MCGIVIVVSRPGRFTRDDLDRAVSSLSHRGPDDAGVERVHADARWDVWFGHARLSLVDLSPAGHQPMFDDKLTTSAITFNGEIYNHRRLRREIGERRSFRTSSDTEVLLAGVLDEGPAFLSRCVGMWAFGVLDSGRGELVVARDRLGKKPLYAFEHEDLLIYASELKAFHALGLPLSVDEESRAHYRWLGYVPGPRAIYRSCRKVDAATTEHISLRADTLETRSATYWDPLAVGERPFGGTYPDAIDELSSLLDDATALRLDADAPVGIFLSGGVDSALVASAAVKAGAEARAFVVKADDAELDESGDALATAAELGIRAEVLHLRTGDYDRQQRMLAWHYDEPMSDLSQLAVLANAEVARRHVKAVLTGDGGDEVFLGYPWVDYPQRVRRIAAPLRAAGLTAAVQAALRSGVGRAVFERVVRAAGFNSSNLDFKIALLRRGLEEDAPFGIYEDLQSVRPLRTLAPADLALLGERLLLERVQRWYPTLRWDLLPQKSPAEAVAVLDLLTYMRDDILVKVDRGTMAYGLEARSPLLDHRVVELGLSLPLAYKAGDGRYKRILRDLAARRVSPRVARLRKRGFGIAAPMAGGAAAWNLYVERLWDETWLQGMST